MFGRMMNPMLGKIHFWGTFISYNAVFFPMHQLGLQGHMRRIYDPNEYAFLEHLQGLNTFVSISAFVLFTFQLLFVVNFIGSWFKGAKAPANPWEDNSLEWSVPSPPPHGNFPAVPVVYRGPYEYSSPMVTEDFLPQSVRLTSESSPAPAPAGD